MMFLFTGSDRPRVLAALDALLAREGKGAEVMRVSDLSPEGDLERALSLGPSLFGGRRAVVLDGLCVGEARAKLLASLPALAESDDLFVVVEKRPDAEAKRALEKYATAKEIFEEPLRAKERSTVFELAERLQSGGRKELWVAYQRELLKDEAPEAIHGVLFWAAKRMFLAAHGTKRERAASLLAALAELPHESRRRGEELEYALERFLLTSA